TEVRLCAAEACQAIGARQLTKDVLTACETLPPVSLVPVYCLGLCSVAPAAMVGGKLIGRANVEKIKNEILNQSEEVVA
ncbi:MAG: NAD(P)H-dependent oxidoreductase subunit E, partial [Kordiimonadaceae bacterium]|nr:NAD(P)H-dependent oxidoreductase subunit E [Kordiimonadaceae bacterium]